MLLQHEMEKIPEIFINVLLIKENRKKVSEVLRRTKKDAELFQKLERVIRSQKIPYSKGAVYYCIDRTNKSIIVFVPVRRRTLSVGEAVLNLEERLKESLHGWNIEVYTKRFLNYDSWGVQKDKLRKISIK